MSEKTREIENQRYAQVYWKRPITINQGHGAVLVDSQGREYIDCTSNYGVAITGHSHPRVVQAITEQAGKLMSCHGSYYNEARSTFLEKLGTLTPDALSRVYLSNSGTEAVEYAMKLARKATGKTGYIAMMNGFHGKTMGSLSLTWKKKYRNPFTPLLPGVTHVPFGKTERLESAVTEDTAAVILEPIQGEGGVNVPPEGYLGAVRDLCTDKGVLMILDEIQTGVGRTGKFLASMHDGVEPDILCLSKALASGIPLAATLTTEEQASKLSVGDHSSTFGGGPVACAAGSATLDVLVEEKLMEHADSLGSYMLEELGSLSEFSIVRNVRGKGMMMAVELRFGVLDIMNNCMDRGVLLLEAGRNVLRLLPPLVLTREQADTVVQTLRDVIGEEETARQSS